MTNITVGRYQNPETKKYWQGWIEPEDRSWIMFIAADGKPVIYLDRDESGAVIAQEDLYLPYPGWLKEGVQDRIE